MIDNPTPANPAPQPNRYQIIEAVAVWKATPAAFRQEHTLNQLAHRLGVRPNGRFYDLADSVEVYNLMLTKVAGDALDQVPEILHTLAEKAKAGNVRAAQVYLDWVRQVLTDERFLSNLQPAQSVTDILADTAQAAESLLQLADALGNDEEEAKSVLGNWKQQ